MSEFAPITTQEEFDTAIGERLRRERESISKQYSDYDDLKAKVKGYEEQIDTLNQSMKDSAEKYAGYDKTLAELQAQVKNYETSSVKMRIAHETGLPWELAERLAGETEEDIRKDAESMTKIIKPSPSTPRQKSSEPGAPAADPIESAYKRMLKSMKGD